MAGGYRFGAVEIRPAERQVVVDGRPAALGSRAFDVLLALVERRERVVTKNELLDLAWPGLVVEENNLQAHLPKAPARDAAAAAEPHPASERLPRLTAPLLGRHDELAALGRLLEQHRLVTVSGPAGIGKTSVAIAAAEERQAKLGDGAAWIELGPIAEGMLVPAAIAQALQVQAPSGGDIRAALIAALKGREILLVIDNAEHVLDAVAQLADAILAEAPRVSVLATSRSALKLREERIFRLGPLGVPEADVPVDEARSHGAVALLEARAQALDPRFALSEENVALAIGICRNLDGIALAIELAAARLPVLGLKGLAERIGERFRLLTAGTRNAPTRQQTLLAALDWSYELLSAAEQKVFRRLGVFAGGFPLAIATAVSRDESTDEWAAIDALAALVDRSLVEVEAGAAPRYRLLESTRAYALLKLRENAAELAEAQRAHAAAMLAYFADAEEHAWSLPEGEWLATYAPELDNLRAALDWSVQHDRALGAALLGQARFLFVMSGLDYELRERCERLDPAREEPLAPADAAAYWRARGEVTRYVHREGSYRMLVKAAELYRSLGDDRGRFLALSDAVLCSPAEERRALVDAMLALERPEWPARIRYWGLRAYAYADLFDGRVAEVGRYLERSLELARACRSPALIDRSLSNLADHALAVGDPERAASIGRELMGSMGGKYNTLVAQGNLANALLQLGEVEEARGLIARFHGQARAMQWDTFATFAPVFALLAASEGRARSAARLMGYAEMHDRKMGGDAEPNERRAQELAMERVAAVLPKAEIEQLMSEGEGLSEDEVCALTLDSRA